jgi:galactokinase
VNLLGEHTDYNDGFVFPAAIDRHISVVAARRDDSKVRAYSLDFSQTSTFDLGEISPDKEASWSNYVRGVIVQFQSRGFSLPGMDLLLWGNVPIGAGLSSSAALEVATAETCRVLGDFDIAGTEMALLCQAAEREFVGVNCGIMDQFVSALAEEDTALFLDCRDLSYSLIPTSFDARIVVCDSRVQRSLDSSAYNQRRSECEKAVRILSEVKSGIQALRDVTLSELLEHSSLLPKVIFQRAHHVVSENERVLEGIQLLRKGDVGRFGELLYGSHVSLRDDYEVSCTELDQLVEIARQQPGIVGARMTGAGFGGCTVNLVETSQVESFCSAVKQEYKELTELEAFVYVCQPSEGVTSQ